MSVRGIINNLALGGDFAAQREALIGALRNAPAETARGILATIVDQHPAFADTVELLINSSVDYAVSLVRMLDAELAEVIAEHQDTFVMVQQLMKGKL